MPWLVRFLLRLLSLAALGALRGTIRTPGTVPPRHPPWTSAPRPPVVTGLEVRIRHWRDVALETLRIVGHGLGLVAFLAATAVLATAGTTTATLGPRWVGILFLVLAGATLVAAVAELRIVWRLRMVQVRRRRQQRLLGR